MKNKFLYCIVSLAMVMMAACSSDRTADVKSILRTIPSDASAVMVIDLKSVLEKAGCEVDGTTVKPGKGITKVLESSANANIKEFLSNAKDGGMDPSAAALFIEGYNTYLTGFISDTNKFKASVEKEFGGKFEKEGDAEICGNMAVSGDRFWWCVNSNNSINANEIKHFVSLSEKQSILSNEIAAKLEDLEHDIEGWGDIKGCLNSLGLDFTSRASATMAIEAMFVDAVEFAWNIDFLKGKLEAEVTVLNSKGGIAKFNFPAAKIDAAVINKLGGTAAGFGALAVNPDMVKKLKEETGGKGFSMIGMLAGMVSCVDGTCAVALSDNGNMRGLISTTGHGTSDLVEALGQFGFEVNKEDKYLRINKGDAVGNLPASEAAEELKGSLAGFVYSGNMNILPSGAVSLVAITFKPEKGGLEMNIKVKGKDQKKNILLSIIEAS